MLDLLRPVDRPSGMAVGRFAPSPTGRLHLGNLRTALAAEEDIRSRGGIFILRVEDTDIPRNVAGAEAVILDDLRWLGVSWDEGPDVGGPAKPYRQSERGEFYEGALRQLARQGLIYPCTCSRKDLQSGASAPHGAEGPIYPGNCRRDLPTADIDAYLTDFLQTPWQERGACLRIRADRLPTANYHDELQGVIRVDLEREIGDFVVLRRDGLWAYQFVCAVDDALMGVTRVVRGDDLVSSAPRQAAIIRAFGLDAPVYRHVPLVFDGSGERFSKRAESASLQPLRAAGKSPQQARDIIAAL